MNCHLFGRLLGTMSSMSIHEPLMVVVYDFRPIPELRTVAPTGTVAVDMNHGTIAALNDSGCIETEVDLMFQVGLLPLLETYLTYESLQP